MFCIKFFDILTRIAIIEGIDGLEKMFIINNIYLILLPFKKI